MNNFTTASGTIFGIFFSCLLFCFACTSGTAPELEIVIPDVNFLPPPQPKMVEIHRDIPIRGYFEFMDSLVAHLDTTLSYCIDEHIIVRANPWLIDTLQYTDYYYLMERGVFTEDPQSLLALQDGQELLIPDSLMAESIREKLAATVIDINIPEFKLRIIEGDQELHTFPVRVGRVQKKYLAMAGKEVDLRTRTGIGSIIRINRSPLFINPSNNKRYHSTRRDDGKVTKLPRAPWIEPELDGQRYGQLIHPTTNPATLEKAYSNGCIGVGEGDMWRIYYHAPVGTRVVVRYDLEVIDPNGDTTFLKNIYPGFERKSRKSYAAVVSLTVPAVIHDCVCEGGLIKE
jgi:hypothetical protein